MDEFNARPLPGLDPGHTKTRIVDPSGGPGVDTNIQQAIDNLGANGGVVYVEQATYTIDSAIRLPSNVSLLGRGNAVIQIEASADVAALRNRDYAEGNEGITAIGFHIRSRDSGQTNCELVDLGKVSDCLLQDLTIDGVRGKRAGISLGGESQRNRITNCRVTRCSHGIALWPGGGASGPSKNLIDSNRIHNCHVGLYVWKGHFNTLRGNVCHDMVPTDTNIIGHDGILMEESCENVVQGNICYHNCEHGIYVAGTATGQSWGNALTGNVCYDNARCGIHLCGQVNCNVHKNSVVGNNCCHNHDGIALDNYAKRNTLTGNICTENSRYGIWELGIGPDRNIILGNICVNNSSGQIRQDVPGTHTVVEHNQTS